MDDTKAAHDKREAAAKAEHDESEAEYKAQHDKSEAEYKADGTVDPYYCGLRFYYDKRVDAFLNVEDPTQVQFARLAYQFEN